jgi:hypothetical protein
MFEVFIESLILELDVNFYFKTRDLDRVELIARFKGLKDFKSWNFISIKNSAYVVYVYL